MKKTVDMSADEALKKIEAAITGERPRVIISCYIKNEFVGEVHGNKFEIQRTKSNGSLSRYIYARVFHGTVTDTPDGKAEIEGEFEMNGIIKGMIITLFITAIIGVVYNIFMGEAAIGTIVTFAVYVLANILVFKLYSMISRKDEIAVLEFLESFN